MRIQDHNSSISVDCCVSVGNYTFLLSRACLKIWKKCLQCWRRWLLWSPVQTWPLHGPVLAPVRVRQNPVLPMANLDLIMVKLFRRVGFCLLTNNLNDCMLLFQLDSFIFLYLLAKWTSDLLSAKCWKNCLFTPSTWWTPAESVVGNKAVWL